MKLRIIPKKMLSIQRYTFPLALRTEVKNNKILTYKMSSLSSTLTSNRCRPLSLTFFPDYCFQFIAKIVHFVDVYRIITRISSNNTVLYTVYSLAKSNLSHNRAPFSVESVRRKIYQIKLFIFHYGFYRDDPPE